MALRTETKSFACLTILAAVLIPAASAQTFTYEVRHRHVHGGAAATLRISPESLSFEDHNKNNKGDSREWKYGEIQQLTIGVTEIRVLTYEDSKWKLGRDREYVFDRIPSDLAIEVYPMLSRILDQRFIAAVASPHSAAQWEIGAKLTRDLKGAMGRLIVSNDRIVFDTKKRSEARSWRIADVENVSSSGPFDLTITTGEKTGAFRGGHREFHFQLEEPLPEDRYNALWREVNRSKGLSLLSGF